MWYQITMLYPLRQPTMVTNPTTGEQRLTKAYKSPKYFKPFRKTDLNPRFPVNPNVTNNILKLKTGNYPLMPILKHSNQNQFDTDHCPFCNFPIETLHHILYQYERYDSLRDKLNPKYFRSDAQILQRNHLILNTHPRKLNIYHINTFLQKRWNHLKTHPKYKSHN